MRLAERAIVWSISSFPQQNASGRYASTRYELLNSIASARLYSADADSALLLMHDGTVDCTTLQMDRSLKSVPCVELPSLEPPSVVQEAACQVGARKLVIGELYLTTIVPNLLELDETAEKLFSYRVRDPQSMSTWHRGNTSTRLDGNTTRRGSITTTLSGNSTATVRGKSEALGLGAWYRYLSHLLLPLGIAKALYMDLDTCVMASITPLFSVNDSAPLVVARRESGASQELTMFLAYKGLNATLAQGLFGFNMGAIPLSFNNGVMLINLVPYCVHGIWPRMKRLVTLHSTPGTRMFKATEDIHGGGSALGDNDVVVVVAASTSHFVGAEWNCRRPAEFNTHRTINGTKCRVVHQHELSSHYRVPWLPSSAKKHCARMIARWTAEKA